MPENDLQAALNKLLANPEALSGLMNMAGSLFGNVSSEAVSDTPAANTEPGVDTASVPASAALSEPPKEAFGEQTGTGIPDFSALEVLISGTKKNDPRCTLLHALRPYMSHERAQRIDHLVKALKLADIAGGLLSKGGLF